MRIALLFLAAVAAHGQRFVADYDSELRESAARADGIRHVDTPALMARLRALHVTSYFYLVWHARTDWDDLKDEFLPAARKAAIDVWVYLVPPSECRPACSLPFADDYVRWGRELSQLARKYPNLKGWVIDDFDANIRKTFTPAYMAQMREAATGIRFMPLVYSPALTKEFLDAYAPVIDGVVMAFRDGIYRNTQITESLTPELDKLTALMKPYGKELVLMIYAAKLASAAVPPSAAYLRETVSTGMRYLREGKIGGIVTYVLPKDGRTLPASENPAHGGSGYGSLWVPAGSRSAAGDYGELGAETRAGSGEPHLRFWRHVSFGTPPPRTGHHFLQVLADGQVIWEQDLAAAPQSQWDAVSIDLTARPARLAFRLTEKQTGSRPYVAVRLDDIETTGFAMPDAGFEASQSWTAGRSHPAMLATVERFDPDRARHAFEAVQELYADWR